jgi:hypothetical protein
MTEIDARELDRLRKKAGERDDAVWWCKIGIGVIAAVLILLIGVIFTWKLVTPTLNLRKANTEKQAVIKEQEAKSKAAEFEAQSAVTRAQARADAMRIEASGIADSQEIIAATLTPEYLQWRYLEVLENTENQVIYVPADGSIPITEAGRAVDENVTVTVDQP